LNARLRLPDSTQVVGSANRNQRVNALHLPNIAAQPLQ
jgi:hypothetical protein